MVSSVFKLYRVLLTLDDEQNAQDLSEIIEFVRMGTLLIQETLQPSKQDYISPDTLHQA
jgi:uncharacterized protein YgfB (UPF0149 family)